MTPNRLIASPSVRRWLYSITTAALAVLGVYGLVTAEQAAAWAGLAAAVTAVAAANTPSG